MRTKASARDVNIIASSARSSSLSGGIYAVALLNRNSARCVAKSNRFMHYGITPASIRIRIRRRNGTDITANQERYISADI
jgi:hypothetical protein